jgi:Bacterial Ig domain/SdrD B-like domain
MSTFLSKINKTLTHISTYVAVIAMLSGSLIAFSLINFPSSKALFTPGTVLVNEQFNTPSSATDSGLGSLTSDLSKALGDLVAEGVYRVGAAGTKASDFHFAWVPNSFDGSGFYLANLKGYQASGNLSALTANIPIVAGKTYRFEMEAASTLTPNYGVFPNLALEVDGVSVDSTGSIGLTPKVITVDFVATSTGTKALKIISFDSSVDGNDLMINYVKVIEGTSTPNNPPVANNDNYSTNIDVPVILKPITNDTDLDNDSLQVTKINGIAIKLGDVVTVTVPNGKVEVSAFGIFNFIPTAGYIGTTSFDYEISDGQGGTSIATEKITIIAPGTPVLTKKGTDSVTKSETLTTKGSTIDWVVDYDAAGGVAPVNPLNIKDIIPAGQKFVAGSLKAPSTFTKTYSADAGTTFNTTEPTASNAIALDGYATSGNFGVYTSLKSAPALALGGGGDGYHPIIYKNRVYAIFHHTRSDSDQFNLTCIDPASGLTCPGYPVKFSSTPGIASTVASFRNDIESTNHPTVATITDPIGYFHKGSKIFYGGQRLNDFGVGCFDLDTQENCAYLKVGDLPRYANSENPAAFEQFRTDANGKMWLLGADAKMYCVDTASMTLCPGQPFALSSNFVPYTGNQFHAPHEMIGNKIYFAVHYDLAGHLPSKTSVMSCFDVITKATCAGYTDKTGYGSTNFSLYPKYNASMIADGICSSGPYDGAGPCFDLVTGAGISGIPNFNGSSLYEEFTIGTKTYFVHFDYKPAIKEVGYCYDWSIQAGCAGFGDTNNKIYNPADLALYGLNYNEGCMYGLGNAGVLISFSATTGVSPCVKNKITLELTPKEFYCDGKVHSMKYDKVKVIEGLPSGVTGKVTVYQNDGATVVSGFNQVDLGTNGELDISTIPVSGTTDKIKVFIEFTGSIPSTGLNIEVLYASADKPQICYSTIVDPTFTGATVDNTVTSPQATSAKASLAIAGTITGKVYVDTNNSGTQDSGTEPDGIIPAGTTVVITDKVDSTKTFTVVVKADGTYTQDVPAGTYTVKVTAPTGYTVSTSTELGDGTGANSTEVTVGAGETKSQGKDGLYQPGKITGKVYLDPNNSGVQEAGEPDGSIPATVTVELKPTTGASITAVVKADGTYEAEVPAGTYEVIVTAPTGYTITGGSNPTTGKVVTSGATTDAGNDGLYQPGKIKGKVYLDNNNSALQEGTEPDGTIPAGTKVELKPATGASIMAVLNPDGTYETEVPAGTYTVTVTAPTGYTVSGSTNPTTSKAVVAGATTDAGSDGLYKPGKITGKIYIDVNNSGTQEAGEPDGTIPAGTTVVLKDSTGTIFPVVIKADGTYETEVPAGTYEVKITAPAGYTVTGGSNPTASLAVTSGNTTDAGKDGLYLAGGIEGTIYLDNNNSGTKDGSETDPTVAKPLPAGTTVEIKDAAGTVYPATLDLTTGKYTGTVPAGTYTVTVTAPTGLTVTGTTNPTTGLVVVAGAVKNAGMDGLYQPGKITGQVYLDNNNSGTQDTAIEPNASAGTPIPTTTKVVLTDKADATKTFTVTLNPDGTYTQDVPAGTYTVIVTAPTGYTVSTSTELGDGTGANPTEIIVGAGETKSQGKDGLYKPGKITGKIYIDVNNSGTQEAGEPDGTIPAGTTVVLKDSTGTIFPVVIKADGTYETEVPAGTYEVKITAPAGYTVTGGSNPTASLAVTSGNTTDAGKDGLYLAGGIEGTIYLDNNNSGTKDGSETDPTVAKPLPAGTTVEIKDAAGTVYPATLDLTTGKYTGTVPAGTYTVTVTAPTGLTVTGTTNPTTGLVVVAGAVKNAGMDGLYQPGKIKGKVYLDPNYNGIQDANEPNGNLPTGTSVILQSSTGLLIPVTLKTDGTYELEVVPNDYFVIVIYPEGYVVSEQANPTLVNTVVAGATHDAGIEGLYKETVITGLVFNDLDKDGVKDPNEIFVPNVKVTALDTKTGKSSVVYTDANGEYTTYGSSTTMLLSYEVPPGYDMSIPDTQTIVVAVGDVSKQAAIAPLTVKPIPVPIPVGTNGVPRTGGQYSSYLITLVTLCALMMAAAIGVKVRDLNTK